MSQEIKRNSDIIIRVGLDAQNVPVHIEWKADDNPSGEGFQACKAFLLAMFDTQYRDTLKIDLWTQDMQVVEMDRFFYQTLRGMADTYVKATQNLELGNAMQQFVQHFGEKTGILERGN